MNRPGIRGAPTAAQWRGYGTGTPVTLVVHGLGATEGEARIPASGLRGTRVVVTLPGHGSAPDPPDGYWTYQRIAEDVLTIADEVGARQAAGVSLGAGALTRIAAEHPDRFDRLALLLPAALDQQRDAGALRRFDQLADAVEAAGRDGGESHARGDRRDSAAALRELVAAEVPEGTDVGDYAAQRAAALLRLREALRAVPGQRPVASTSALAAASAEVLVVGATADVLHPPEVAAATARAFRHARLELLDSAAPMLTHRRALRSLLVDFLG